MKKLTRALAAIAAISLSGSLSAADFFEGFESETFPPAGWSIEKDDATISESGNWARLYKETGMSDSFTGKACAVIDPVSDDPEYEQSLITPEIQLAADRESSLSFKWYAQKIGFEQGSTWFHVKVSTDGGATWNILWDMYSKEDIENSEVLWPWYTWHTYISNISLAAYKGQNVKFAFYFKTMPYTRNEVTMTSGYVKIDDVQVNAFEPKQPEVAGSDSYVFTDIYVGLPAVSEPLTLRNANGGELKILSMSGLENTDFQVTLDPATVLGQEKECTYFAIYTPTLTGASSATLKLETTGGTLDVVLSGSKLMVDPGYTVESFESSTVPVGWTATGWSPTTENYSLGFYSMNHAILKDCYLVSPRLDLSSGEAKVTFDYYEKFPEEGTSVPSNALSLEIRCGADDWTEIWSTYDIEFSYDVINCWMRITVDLTPYLWISTNPSNPDASKILHVDADNVQLRWSNTGDWSGGFETIASDIFLDNVVLPHIFGEGVVPAAATGMAPMRGLTNANYTDMVLTWNETLFTDGYKIYMGTDRTNPTSLLDGVIVTETSYPLPDLEPATTYYWKIVPFNEYGDAETATLMYFSTMEDQTIRTFPYFEGFEGDGFPSLGWMSLGDGLSWTRNEYGAYSGRYCCSVRQSKNNASSMLQTPLVEIPAEGENVLKFVWVKVMPVLLTSNNSVVASAAASVTDTLSVEVKEEGGDWVRLAYTVNESSWETVELPLNAYAGKSVKFRWKYSVESSYYSEAGAIDNIYIGDPAMSGVEDLSAAKVQVYPNPVTDRMYVVAPEDARVEVYDVAGHLALTASAAQPVVMESLATGVYVVKVIAADKTETVRILKK